MMNRGFSSIKTLGMDVGGSPTDIDLPFNPSHIDGLGYNLANPSCSVFVCGGLILTSLSFL